MRTCTMDNQDIINGVNLINTYFNQRWYNTVRLKKYYINGVNYLNDNGLSLLNVIIKIFLKK